MMISQSVTFSEEKQDSQDLNTFKILVLGPSGSGKTSIINCLLDVQQHHDLKSTSCYEVHSKYMTLDDKSYLINYWDCGAYHYQSYPGVKKVIKMNILGALCALIVFDCSNIEFMKSVVDEWITECYDFDIYQIFIIMNKVDLLDPNSSSIDSDQFNFENRGNAIQLSRITSNYEEIKLKEINDFCQERDLRYYMGSTKQFHKSAIQYNELLLQLVRENVNYSSQKFQSDKLMATQYKKKLQESYIRQSTIIEQQKQEEEEEKKKCSIF